MKHALESLIEAVNLAGGRLSTEMLQGDVYNLLNILNTNGIRFYYVGGKLPGSRAGKMYPVPLRDAKDCAIVTVRFERNLNFEEQEALADNFESGKIKVDPDQDLPGAVVAQLVLELQDACDNCGLDGNFETMSVELDVAIDYKELANQRRMMDTPSTGGKKGADDGPHAP